MLFSVSSIAWDDSNNEFFFTYLKKQNLDAIEIVPGRVLKSFSEINTSDIRSFTKLIQSYNLAISSMQSILFGTSGLYLFESQKSRQNLFDHLKLCCDLAESISCKNVVFGCPKNRISTNISQDYDTAIEFFKDLGDYLKGYNAKLLIEGNPTIYGGNFLTTTLETNEFINHVSKENIKLLLDTSTIIENKEDLPLNLIMKNVEHIHLSRPYLKFYEDRDFDTIFLKQVEKYNYNGYISLETMTKSREEACNCIDYLCELRKGL